ncbi:hypothetical protein SAY86_002539 [Trapa natans]|uniref:Origin recognition complex subunit 1 n=1 Tax=Trapa natans TaxID=22666 RepID=A0AAN7LI01_TRANT|nr:hypothetical protein SAY86_002539 [Trapa natans]
MPLRRSDRTRSRALKFAEEKEAVVEESSNVSIRTSKKRKTGGDESAEVAGRARASNDLVGGTKKKRGGVAKKKVLCKVMVYDGGEFGIGNNVYVRNRDDTGSENEDPEVAYCRICFGSVGTDTMIECDGCLGGFHLKCLKPPLEEVPEGEWICEFCEAKKMGMEIELPKPPKGKKRARTASERLLSGDLWAARIESLWREIDGACWCRVRWYIIPEETAAGRRPHNQKREIYITNSLSDIEMESVVRHCSVKNPKEYGKDNVGDDVFMCEYEYDVLRHSFKRLPEIEKNGGEDDNEKDGESPKVAALESNEDMDFKRLPKIEKNGGEDDNEKDGKSPKVAALESSEDMDFKRPPQIEKKGGEDDNDKYRESPKNAALKSNEDTNYDDERAGSLQTKATELAENSRKGELFELQKIGTEQIPQHTCCHKQTELERAKAALLLTTLPKSLPCREKEMNEISTFIKGAIHGDQCSGRCLYVHGVPGSGKTMSVLAVMRNLKSQLDDGLLKPYCFVDINALKLASQQNIYKVIYQSLTGNSVNWKKALQLLNERFSEGTRNDKEHDPPCILLIDELDELVTGKQSVLYNILHWTTKSNYKLTIIGIANTMDLPEKLLPQISSRMGFQRLCFGPYNYQQLQEIISSRLEGIDAFEKQGIEFVSRKVAAISGDARRALDICRRAAEIADYRIKSTSTPVSVSSGEKALVGIGDIDESINEMFQRPHIQVMSSASRMCKLFLAAMVCEQYKTRKEETTFEKLATAVLGLCTSNQQAFPGRDALMRVGCMLGECRIIICQPRSWHRLQKLRLNFSRDDVTFALKNNSKLPWLDRYL